MARSLKKGPYSCPGLVKKIEKAKAEIGTKNKIVVKTDKRASTILPLFVGVTVMVHNGKTYMPVLISESMVGQKLGEFAPTRTYRGHSAGDKKTTASSGGKR